MKRIFVLLAVMIVVLLTVTPVFAEDEKSDKVFTYMDFRNDVVNSEKTGGQNIQSAVLWWQAKYLGGVVEPEFRSKNHYERIKSALLWKVSESWYLLGGISVDSQGSDFVQVGVWRIGKIGPFNSLLDARNYFSTSGQSNGYTDNLFRLMYPFTNKLSVGLDVCYDHWWQDSRNLYFAGPRITYQLTENINLYARFSREWNTFSTGTEYTDRFRVGIVITY
jgi:hypothetical protein